MKFCLSLLFCLIFLSCSTMDTNQVRQSTSVIKGGQSGNATWNDSLKIKRTSWFHKANLLYEINIAQVPLDSPFLGWLDVNERSITKKCKQILWVIDYYYDLRRVQPNYVKNLLSESGYVDLAVPNFNKNFLNHPDTGSFSNKSYKMQLFCNESKVYSGITATIPGFKQESIEF